MRSSRTVLLSSRVPRRERAGAQQRAGDDRAAGEDAGHPPEGCGVAVHQREPGQFTAGPPRDLRVETYAGGQACVQDTLARTISR
jgi:hypothetical protein